MEAGDFAGDFNEAGTLKTRTYIEALVRMRYEVVGVGERELGGGLDAWEKAIEGAALPFVSATWTDRGAETTYAKPYEIREYDLGRRKLRVAFVVLSAFNSTFARTSAAGRAVVARDPADQARRWIPEARGKADLVVLLANLSPRDLERVAGAVPGMIDLALGTYGDRISPGKLETIGGVQAFYAGDQGKRLGEVRISLDGKAIRSLTAHDVFLTRRYPEDPEFQRIVDGTVARVNEILRSSPPPAPSTASPGTVQVNPAGPSTARKFLAADACSPCHEKEHRVWESTGHARAMGTLVREKQDFNPECVKCHTTGYGMPEGFHSARTTPSLVNVQCEACHGSGALHVLDTARPYGRVAPRVCYTCHTRENSPEFSFFQYWEKIKH